MFHKNFRKVSLIFAGLFCVALVSSFVTTLHYNSQFRILYSLDDRNIDQELIKLINRADDYLYFAIYFFTLESVADALVRAKERGVIVRGITDSGASEESNKTVLSKLRTAGIQVTTEKHQDGIMHIKALVTEDAYASGSYNWTRSATLSNDEILEVGTNRSVRKKYLDLLTRIIEKNSR